MKQEEGKSQHFSKTTQFFWVPLSKVKYVCSLSVSRPLLRVFSPSDHDWSVVLQLWPTTSAVRFYPAAEPYTAACRCSCLHFLAATFETPVQKYFLHRVRIVTSRSAHQC